MDENLLLIKSISELEVGRIYTRFDDATFMVLYITGDCTGAIILSYSSNHKIACVEVINDEYFSEKYPLYRLRKGDGEDIFNQELTLHTYHKDCFTIN